MARFHFRRNASSSQPQPESAVFPDVLLRQLLRRYFFLCLISLFVANAYLILFPFDPSSDWLQLLGGAALGLVFATCFLYRSDWVSNLSFAEYLHRRHFTLHCELNLRRKVDAKVYRGSVYVLQDVDVTGWYKIGKTSAPAERIGYFDTMLPFQTRLVHIIASKNCDHLEAVLHRQFAAKRERGEWFSLSDADIEWMRAMEAV